MGNCKSTKFNMYDINDKYSTFFRKKKKKKPEKYSTFVLYFIYVYVLIILSTLTPSDENLPTLVARSKLKATLLSPVSY